MSTFALILDGQVIQVADADFPVHPDLTWVDIESVSPRPAVGWGATETNGAWTFAAPVIPVPSPTDAILAQISALEATQTPRRIRDAVSSTAGADWLVALETQIEALRAQLPAI